MDKRMIVFSPHPDDETLGCGGTMVKKMSEGYEVIIVVMTDGRYALSSVFGIDSDPTPEELKQIRREEFARAAEILGIPKGNSLLLDFEDGLLVKHKNEAEKKVTEILKKYSPAEVYFPYARDVNMDHQATNQVILNCINKINLSALQCQYSITQKYSRVGPILARWTSRIYKHNLLRVDISKFLPVKEDAIKEFKSQVTIISKKQDRPIISIERFLGREEIFFV